MSKPEINKFTRISELFVQKYERYLPTAFDESMTILQKMNKIIEYLNQVGLIVNEGFEQWNEILEWVMNDGLNESIVNKLNDMLEDGTLGSLINEEVLGSKATIHVDENMPLFYDNTTHWWEVLNDTPDIITDIIVEIDKDKVIE